MFIRLSPYDPIANGRNSSSFCSYPKPNKFAIFIIFLRPISLAIFKGTILEELLKASINDILPR